MYSSTLGSLDGNAHLSPRQHMLLLSLFNSDIVLPSGSNCNEPLAYFLFTNIYNIMVKALVILMGYIQVAFLAHLHTLLLHTSTLLYLHTSSPHTHLSTCTPLHMHTSPHAHLSTCAPLHMHTSTPAHLSTCAPLHMHTSTPADPLLSWLLLLWSSGATDTACGRGLCLL